jgi:hypothetical protein
VQPEAVEAPAVTGAVAVVTGGRSARRAGC